MIHAMIGLYRVAVKWGLTTKRTGLRKIAKGLIIYLIIIGVLSLVSYLIIGSELSLPVEAYRPS